MPYKSDLTGELIKDESKMLVITMRDSSNKLVTRYLANLNELKKWWLAGMPHAGGVVETSSFSHEPIDDESQKISITFHDQSFVFRNLQELKDWFVHISKTSKNK